MKKLAIDASDEDRIFIFPGDGSEAFPICQMSGLYSRQKQMKFARLFAAAPDLLEACKDLLAFMEQYDLLDWDLADDDQARIDATYVAIAKATGGER